MTISFLIPFNQQIKEGLKSPATIQGIQTTDDKIQTLGSEIILKEKNSQTPDKSTLNQPEEVNFGVVVNDYSNKTGELSSLEKILGINISSVSIFKQFGHPSNRDLILTDLEYIKTRGIKLQIAWEPWNPEQGNTQSTDYLKEIPEGKHDLYIRKLASSIKEYGNPVVIRFGHEMNGDWYPWGNRPLEYIQAYRYLHNFFVKEGVTNIKWMWSVNATSDVSKLSRFYPGDNMVDIIGIDGFNFGTTRSFGWQTFTAIFEPTYKYITSNYSKPIIISETASAELGGDKAVWVANLFSKELPLKFPQIKEIIWFNLIKEADWRIDSSESSLQSFKNNL